MSKSIIKWYADYGRMGELEGVFIDDPNLIEEAEGKEIYFGEVLGKHSDISYTIGSEDFQVIETTEEALNLFKQLKLDVGINPLFYYRDQYIDYPEDYGNND